MTGITELATLGDLLVRAAEADPTGTAVVLPPDRVSFAGLLDRAEHMARGLLGLGVEPGDRVGLLMPNCLEFIEGLFALSLLGAVAVPVNTRYQAGELEYLVGHGELAAVVTTDGSPEQVDFEALLRAALPPLPPGSGPLSLPGLPAVRRLVTMDELAGPGFVDRAGLDAAARAAPAGDMAAARRQVPVSATALMLYTSGTTAAPKGCLLSHAAVARTGTARIVERTTALPEVVWTPCPLFHVGAVVPLVGCVATGSTFVTMRRFDAGAALRLLDEERVTTALPLFPAFTDAMLGHPDFDHRDRSSLRQILTTGAAEKVERARAAFAPARLVSAYGMTELCGVMASSPWEESAADRLAWDGTPFSGLELRIVDPATGLEVERGTPGEITARGYALFDGYYRDPGATAAAFDDEGWFHTGDLGVTDHCGRVAFRGRLKDLLKVGGENVAPLEVEAHLTRHPAVRQAEVVGVPDSRLDEVVVAFVELEPGRAVNAEELVAFCRGQIAGFKVPRHIRFVEPGAWPMSATKVNKVALRQRIAEELEATPR